MIDVLVQIGVAKLTVSALLAGLAWVVQRRVDHPAVAHTLWLLVLVALLLPALIALPVLPGDGNATAVIAEEATFAGEAATRVGIAAASGQPGARGAPIPTVLTDNGKPAVVVIWLAVAALLLVWTLARALRFRHWLARTSLPAPQKLLDEAARIGPRLGLAQVPEVCTTTARVSPMVFWAGGKIRLLIPSFLVTGLDREDLRAVIAHELAHVRRRDHYVRWIEWLACSAFWWNPVAWWARRQLRAAEEISCDALGAAAIKSTPRAYARSLLGALEAMSLPPTPPTPALASGVTSVRSSDSLERRLRVLVKGRSSAQPPRWVRAAGAATAACLLPLGLVYCGAAVETPEELEESPESMPIATAELIALVDLNRTDPRAAELNGLWGSDPAYSYWMFGSPSGHIGPLPLADAPVQPVECRLEPTGPESARDGALGACTAAMSDHLRQNGVSGGASVCVVWGSRADDWSGLCDSSWPGGRDRPRVIETDEASRELSVIHISSMQSRSGREQ